MTNIDAEILRLFRMLDPETKQIFIELAQSMEQLNREDSQDAAKECTDKGADVA